ncbi:MAG: DUF945 family protein [Candidatus Methylumidiphilus sp.]
MNKPAIIAATISALGLGYTTAAWQVGDKIQLADAAIVKQLDSPPGLVKMEEHIFRSHVFSSDESVLLGLSLCAKPGGVRQNPADTCAPTENPLYLRLTAHYTHGPLPGFQHVGLAAFSATLTLDAKNDPALLKALAAAPPLSLEGLVKLDGGLVARLSLPAMRLALVDGAEAEQTAVFTSQAISGELRADPGFSAYRADLAIPYAGIAGGAESNTMEIAGLAVHDRMRRVGKNLYAGTDDIHLDKLSIGVESSGGQADGTIRLAVGKLASRYELKAAAGFMDISHRLDADNLSIGGQALGKVSWEGFARHLQAAALDELAGILNGAALRRDGDGAQLQAMRPAGIALAQAGFNLGIERLELRRPDGDARLSANLSLDRLSPIGDSLSEWLSKLRMQADFSATEQAFADTMANAAANPEQSAAAKQSLLALLDGWVRQDFLQREAGRISAKAVFADQQLSLNGKPVVLPALPQTLMP